MAQTQPLPVELQTVLEGLTPEEVDVVRALALNVLTLQVIVRNRRALRRLWRRLVESAVA